ncbi:MAG: CRISPR-associated endoribonuclease Cas6 [bacterium]|nr:CRISPR-associated endoribonuclease Cas6 [bacterium]
MRKLAVYQVNCKVYMMKSVPFERMQIELAYLVDSTLLKTEEYSQLHNKNCYKNYVFDGLKPIEKNRCYQEGKLYTFSIRCLDEKLAKYFEKELAIAYTETMKGLSCEMVTIKRCMIEKLYLLTPAIMKFNDGYWKKSHSFEEFQHRIFQNAVKKYNQYTGEKIAEDFKLYTNIKMLNDKPMKIRYKNISLLGDKFELYIAENETAQSIAYFLLGTGICELNSRGYGYANYRAM